jgi:hypothetical protein
MRRVVRPGGAVVVIETLGTGHESPRTHAPLEEYFAHLERVHGLTRRWVRSDYLFDDLETAVTTCEAFFGRTLAAQVRSAGSVRVPECTAVFACGVATSSSR